MRALARFFRAAYSELPAQVWWLCAVALVNRAGTMVVPFLTLWLTIERSYTVVEAGWLVACFGLGSILGAWLGGLATDRVGPFGVQVASLAGSGALFVVLGRLHGTLELGATLALLGLVADAFRPANYAMVAANCAPQLRGRAFALLRLAVNLGWSIGPALGGLLAKLSYALLFWIDGATSIAAAALLLALRARLAAHGEPTERIPSTGPGPWRDRAFLIALGATFAIALVFMQFLYTVPLQYRRHHGLDEADIGLLSALNSLIIVAVEMALVHALRGRRELPIVAVGAFFIAVGFGITPLGTSFVFASFAVSIWTLGEMLESPLLMSWVASRAGASERGRYLALLTMVHSLALLLAPIVGTQLFRDPGPAWLFGACFVVGSLAALAFLVADRAARGGPSAGRESKARWQD